MSDKPRIHSLKYNALMNVILSSSSLIFPLITIPYASRVLDTSGMGAVSFAQSIIAYFSLFALLGVSMYGVRVCAQARDDREELSSVVEELLVILSVSTTIVFIIYLIIIYCIPRFSSDKPLFLIFGIAIWLASFGVEWFYQAIEQYGYITIRSIVVKLIGLVLMFLFVHSAVDYRVYGAITVFTGYGANILNVIRLRTFITFRSVKKLNIKRHFKSMISFMISNISSGLYAHSDLVILGFLSSNSVVGLYQLVAKIKGMLVMAINSVITVMLPRLSYYAMNNKTKYYNLLIRNVEFVLLFSFAGMACASLCPDSIVGLLGGQKYLGASTSLLYILPALLFVSLNTVLSQYLISSGGEKQYAIVNSIGLFCSIAYCLILIPAFGANGAAISCSLCEFTALMFRCWYARDFLKMFKGSVRLVAAPASAIIAFLIVSSIKHFWWPKGSFVQIVTAGILFSLIYLTCLLIAKEPIITNYAHLFRKKRV